MSIFHYIKKTPKTEEINLLIRLKYGKPNFTFEYIDSLPDSVIDAAYTLLRPQQIGGYQFATREASIDHKKQVISVALQHPNNTLEAEKVIHESLVVYHSLLGTL